MKRQAIGFFFLVPLAAVGLSSCANGRFVGPSVGLSLGDRGFVVGANLWGENRVAARHRSVNLNLGFVQMALGPERKKSKAGQETHLAAVSPREGVAPKNQNSENSGAKTVPDEQKLEDAKEKFGRQGQDHELALLKLNEAQARVDREAQSFTQAKQRLQKAQEDLRWQGQSDELGLLKVAAAKEAVKQQSQVFQVAEQKLHEVKEMTKGGWRWPSLGANIGLNGLSLGGTLSGPNEATDEPGTRSASLGPLSGGIHSSPHF